MKKLPWNEKEAKRLGWSVKNMKLYYASVGIELVPLAEQETWNRDTNRQCQVCEIVKPLSDEHWNRYNYAGSTHSINPRPAGGGRFKRVCMECEAAGHTSDSLAKEATRERKRREYARALRARGSANGEQA